MTTTKQINDLLSVPTQQDKATAEALKPMSGIELAQWADRHEMQFLCSGNLTKTYGRSWASAYLFLWNESKYYYVLVGIKGQRLD